MSDMRVAVHGRAADEEPQRFSAPHRELLVFFGERIPNPDHSEGIMTYDCQPMTVFSFQSLVVNRSLRVVLEPSLPLEEKHKREHADCHNGQNNPKRTGKGEYRNVARGYGEKCGNEHEGEREK